MNIKNEILEKLKSGDTKGALAILNKHLVDQDLKSKEEEFTLIKNLFEKINKDFRINIISNEEYNREISKINQSIIELTNDKNEYKEQLNSSKKKKSYSINLGAFALI